MLFYLALVDGFVPMLMNRDESVDSRYLLMD